MSRILLSALLLMLFASTVCAQCVGSRLESDRSPLERRNCMLEGNFTTMIFGVMRYAESRGDEPAVAAAYLGRIFAANWPEQMQPTQFLDHLGMYFDMLGVDDLEIMEQSRTHVMARRSRWRMREEFSSDYHTIGGTEERFEAFLGSMIAAIARATRLRYEQIHDGESVVFRVTARQE